MIKELVLLQEYMDYYIEKIAFRNKGYYRVIMDNEIAFPQNYFLVKHDGSIELTTTRWNNHPRQAWGTKKPPDKMIGQDIELWLIHRAERIYTFEEWSRKPRPLPFH